ncbi:MAG: hypothetical protein L3K00_04275 [Thermoplasmata archaeon]|nr:hypothetical protein [Thermoplasmata archaeon]
MSTEPGPSPDGPGRRRDSWSLRTIVEEVGGRPLADYQDPSRPTHPYVALKGRPELPTSETRAGLDSDDPVGRVYPPLIGATGRSLHGPAAEHHPATLATIASEPVRSVGRAVHPPGPSHRPERIYLHYLLLHLDRLNDTALAYLRQAVAEEIDHRSPDPRSGGRMAPVPAPSD